MFDLKKTLSEWKRSLRKYESFEEGTIMELESHLLEEFDKQKRNGLADEEAFSKAAAAVGRPEEVGGEYFKDGRRSRLTSPSWEKSRFSAGLLLNYLKVALRTFRRQAAYSLINIFGLAIGMACSLLIMLWVRDELNFDKFHKNGRDIYRVVTIGKNGNNFSSPAPFAPAVTAEDTEVVSAVRIGRIPVSSCNMKNSHSTRVWALRPTRRCSTCSPFPCCGEIATTHSPLLKASSCPPAWPKNTSGMTIRSGRHCWRKARSH